MTQMGSDSQRPYRVHLLQAKKKEKLWLQWVKEQKYQRTGKTLPAMRNACSCCCTLRGGHGYEEIHSHIHALVIHVAVGSWGAFHGTRWDPCLNATGYLNIPSR